MFESVTRLARRALGRADAEEGGYAAVVRRVAESLHRQERVAGGWATEVGVLPPEAFEEEAERMVRSIAVSGD